MVCFPRLWTITIDLGEAMRKGQPIGLVALAGLLCCIQPALANDISTTLGNPHTFTAGTTVAAGTFNGNAVVAAQPSPFNAYIGSNIPNGSNFSAAWEFFYSLPTDSTIDSATVTIGITDSPWEGKLGILTPANTDQVASFTLDSTHILTTLLNTEINSVGTGKNLYEVDTITIPNGDLAALTSGSATFALALQGPGNGVLGPTPFLGAGLDFSTLDIMITPSTVTTVPEPSTLTLLAAGLLALATLILRK